MAPSYRNQNRRQNRTVDHDVFEGLPVRHWRRDYVTVVAPPTVQENNTSQNDDWAVELPHGMPKDYHLLPQHSQDLLRAARSGRIYKRRAPVEDDEADVEVGEKPEKKDEDMKDKGFSAKAWKQVPRHLEGPDVEYLAKRRKGIVAAGSKAAPKIPTVTKATVKRIDAAGNEYVQDIVVPHGQQVEGELISQTEIPDPNAAGIGGLPVHPTPPRRKPANRKKPKGPGRGRKKKHMAPTSIPLVGQIEGLAAPPGESQPGPVDEDGVKIENDGTAQVTQNEEIEMHDGSAAASDNDDSEDGEDEDGDDDEGSIDDQPSPSKAPSQDSTLHQSHVPLENIPGLAHVDTTAVAVDPPITGVKGDTSGSPLKNLAMVTSTPTSPLGEAPNSSLAAPIHAPPIADQDSDMPAQIAEIEEKMQEELANVAPTTLSAVPVEAEAAIEERRAEEEEEEMLLDIVDGANAHLAQSVDSKLDSQTITEGAAPAQEPISIPAEPVPEIAPPHAEEGLLPQVSNIPGVQADSAPPEDVDDDFPDLLGGLEKSLGGPVAEASGMDPIPRDGIEEPAPAADAEQEEPPAAIGSALTEDPASEEGS